MTDAHDARADDARRGASVLAPASHVAGAVHELALMESLIETVIDQLGDQRVAVVRLEIGELAGVATDALQFCFEVCTHDTTLDGAVLEILAIPGRARCRACSQDYAIASLASSCACGSFDRVLVAGDELRLKDVEVH